MGKVKDFFNKIKPSRRKVIQLYAAVLTNANIKGYVTGQIFKGDSKKVCVPGMNCYSCPGAVGACPLGSLQNALSSSNKSTLSYVIGIILLYAVIFGRSICGYLCPAGLAQELLYKIKTPKLKKNRVTRILSYFKYFLLAVMVIGIPLMFAITTTTLPLPAFCKYICPVGTAEGAIGLLSNPNNESYFSMLGGLFTWKFGVLIALLIASIFIYRVFCRFLCPLGALYGLFNKFAVLGIHINEEDCNHCNACVTNCKMDVKHVGDHECILCGECKAHCSQNAIHYRAEEIIQYFRNKRAEKEIVNKDGTLSITGSNEVTSEVTEVVETKQETSIKPIKNKKDKRKIAATIIISSTAGAILLSALVYYNFIDKSKGTTTGNEVGNEIIAENVQIIRNGEGNFNVNNTRGKVTVINFWGTWCGPCVAELPGFISLKNDYYEQVEVIAIHSSGEDVSYINSFIDSAWPEAKIMFGLDGEENKYFTELGGTDIWPMTYIVDQNGIIANKHIGSLDKEKLYSEVTALLK